MLALQIGLALLVALESGCGRVGFDATSIDGYACGSHDEDDDGFPDACDLCPHLPDEPQADGDGDRVGDACDPEPTIARQSLIVFDPFVTLEPEWTATDASAYVTGDELVLLGRGKTSAVRRSQVPAHDLFVVHVSAGTGVNATQIFSIRHTTPATAPGQFYCEIYDSGVDVTGELRFAVSFDDINVSSPGRIVLNRRLGDYSGVMSSKISATLAECELDVAGTSFNTGGARPAFETDEVSLDVSNVDARVSYFVQIRTFD